MRTFPLLILLLLAGCALTAPSIPATAPARFMELRGELVSADTLAIEAGVWEVRLRSTSGLDFLARITLPHERVPEDEDLGMSGGSLREDGAVERLPAAVLTGGFATGRMAADLVPPGRRAVVLSPEYPDVVLDASELADVRRVLDLSLEHIARLLLSAEYLLTRDDVDPERLALIGVSFGGFYAPAAAASDERFRNVALMYAGADFAELIARQLDRSLPEPAATLVGEILALYLQPIEPLRWIDQIAPRPILFVNGLHDRSIPPENSIRLQRRAAGPIDVVWLPTAHLEPGARGMVEELVDSAFSRLPVLSSP